MKQFLQQFIVLIFTALLFSCSSEKPKTILKFSYENDNTEMTDKDLQKQVITILKNRLNRNDIDGELQFNDNILTAELKHPNELTKNQLNTLFTSRGKLEFYLILDPATRAENGYKEVPLGQLKNPVKLNEELDEGQAVSSIWVPEKPEELNSSHIKSAIASLDNFNNWIITISLKPIGAKLLTEISKKAMKKQLAIVIDGVCKSAPVIQDELTQGIIQISGAFDEKEAKQYEYLLNAGHLPVTLKKQNE